MESANLIKLIIAYYKDKVQQEIFNMFLAESYLLIQADADARRIKARENIIAMAHLKNELNKFMYIYNRISSTHGTIDALDKYLQEIKLKIKRLSYQKNNIKY